MQNVLTQRREDRKGENFDRMGCAPPRRDLQSAAERSETDCRRQPNGRGRRASSIRNPQSAIS